MKFKALEINDDQLELLAALIARLAASLKPDIDEVECFDIAREYVETVPLDVRTIDTLAEMMKSTAFDPEKHLMN
jgi:hypothetical protein